MSVRVAVLGGGVAGVTVASTLAKHGVAVDLFESSSQLGGLHRSVSLEGFCFDIGAFIFSPEHELLRSFPFLAEHFLPAQPGYSRITPSGRVDTYPLSLAGYMRDEGLLRSFHAAASLAASKLRHRRKDTVAAYAKYHMGTQVYHRSGLQKYIERLYGLPDSEVGLQFAVQRLQMLEQITPRVLLERQLRQGWSALMGRSTMQPSRALVRPPQGFSFVYSLVKEHLEKLGVTISFSADVTAIRRSQSGFEVDVGGQTRRYHRVVSTIPIPVAQKLAGLEPWSGFETMKLYSLFYVGRLRHDRAVQYNFTPDGRWKRITGFSKYYGSRDGRDYWVVEITTRDTSRPSLTVMQDDFERHGRRIGLFEGSADMVGALVTDNAYPVFREGYAERLVHERNKLSAVGVDAVGRQGAFEYISSLQTAAKARQLGETMGSAIANATSGVKTEASERRDTAAEPSRLS